MRALSRHGPRVAVSLLPLLLAVLHVLGVAPLGFLQRLDDIIDDARLRWTMPATLDPRVVIVDVDEKASPNSGNGRGPETAWPSWSTGCLCGMGLHWWDLTPCSPKPIEALGCQCWRDSRAGNWLTSRGLPSN